MFQLPISGVKDLDKLQFKTQKAKAYIVSHF